MLIVVILSNAEDLSYIPENKLNLDFLSVTRQWTKPLATSSFQETGDHDHIIQDSFVFFRSTTGADH
jgi:hypothetical protein